MKKFLSIILILAFAAAPVFSQTREHIPSKERGNSAKRAKVQMEGNRIRTTIHNFAFSGRTGGEFPISVQTPYEWPKNTGQVYLALQALLIGGEVIDDAGEKQRIIDVPSYRTSPQGASWNIEPVPGYYNDNRPERSVATSVDPTTWPDFWPDRLGDQVDPGWKGAWNGYFGKDVFNADQEVFYRASDDKYDRYVNYFPDTTDLTRKGMGLIIDVRALAWSQVLVQDAIYLLHTIKNDGTKDLDKVGVTVWFADFVGGNGDSQDDISEFDLLEDILWARDTDNRAPDFGNNPVGIVAVSFLETPGNATDRIDNDGDGMENGPIVPAEWVQIDGEPVNPDADIPDNLIDDNGNGLVDENQTHIKFDNQAGVQYADYIDNDGDAEEGAPVVTQEMVSLSKDDKFKRWPLMDSVQNGKVHLLMVEDDDIGSAFKDYIDNDGDGEEGSPVVTQEMIDAAASDAPYYRYQVPGTDIILYDVKAEDLGKKYADGIDDDGNGAVDEFMDEGIDEMVDEARNDGIDNDGDWDPLKDDVGLDGVPDTGDPGENDGKPTSGVGTGLPGEPNVDVTDVSETDQIGITNAQKIPAGGLNINSDAQMWFDFMIPGKFFSPFPVLAGEYDLFVSSSFFPLKAGQTEPISLAVMLANGPADDPDGLQRKAEILRKRVRVQETYNNDYQFANAPITPTVTAIAGDNRVTLYWDDEAEKSFDRYINNIGGNGRDFEGYKIYRASDPAFLDAENITNGYGIKQFRTPIAQFDLKDGIMGFDSSGIDGVHYYLGNDTGLQHSFVDSTVQNGFTYYYAVVSYDFGFPAGDIIPTESPMRISLQADGSVKLGKNVVVIKPEAPAAGYVPPSLGTIKRIEGSTTGSIFYDIVDINKIKDGHVYYITFEDTIKAASKPGEQDTLTTKTFTLVDSTDNVTLIDRSPHMEATYEQPIIDGFRLKFKNEDRVDINKATSKWNTEDVPPYSFEKFTFLSVSGEPRPNDYDIIFGEVGEDTSIAATIAGFNFSPVPVNFKVYNRSAESFIDFVFMEVDGNDGKLTAKGAFKDRIVFVEKNTVGDPVYTWWFYLANDTTGGYRFPQAGDTASIRLKKPFLSTDKFRFVAKAGYIDEDKAKADLDRIKVVPNPYLASALWEPANPFSSGRGPRDLHFTHLPAKCTIRIFTINGELVKTIEHQSQYNDGTASWNLLSKDNLSISYGIYIYHIDAPGIGQKVGKFAVIK